MTKKALESNIWKLLLFSITQRRHFFPLLSIFYLTFPNTDAQQIGIYVGIGTLASVLLEIPTGYFSDHFGHKKTLLISTICMLGSTVLFLFSGSFMGYVAGSILLSSAFAFQSGTFSAFLHDTMSNLKREKDYARVSSANSANASFVSMILIIALPFLTVVDIKWPFYIGLWLDVIGLLLCWSLVDPPKEAEHRRQPHQTIRQLLHEAKKVGILPFSIFTGLIEGFSTASSSFRDPYLLSIGYPLILIGTVMGFSRLVWFVIGHRVHLLEKIPLKKILLIEMFLFPGVFILAATLNNPYVIGLLFALGVGYFWGREKLLEEYFIRKYIRKPKYKATLLSIGNQVSLLIQAIASFGIGYLMVKSYQHGYLVIGVLLFALLAATYPFLAKQLQNDAKEPT